MAKLGGRRPGAGRPKVFGKRIARSYRFPEWLAEWLATQKGNETALVIEAIVKTYGLTPPTKE